VARGQRQPGQERATPRFEARCVWCGQIELASGGLEIHVGSETEGLAEFRCPLCGRVNLLRLGPVDLATLMAAGVRQTRGLAPFELLEERSGPPITWDDIIDFHEAFARAEAVPELPRIDRSSEETPGYERDAA
jgi:predicted RNA-binding Zn-ribbon protein involved in translation (DUF1610 family)